MTGTLQTINTIYSFSLRKKRGCLFNDHFVSKKTNQKDSGRNRVNTISPLLHSLWFWVCSRSDMQLISDTSAPSLKLLKSQWGCNELIYSKSYQWTCTINSHFQIIFSQFLCWAFLHLCCCEPQAHHPLSDLDTEQKPTRWWNLQFVFLWQKKQS